MIHITLCIGMACGQCHGLDVTPSALGAVNIEGLNPVVVGRAGRQAGNSAVLLVDAGDAAMSLTSQVVLERVAGGSAVPGDGGLVSGDAGQCQAARNELGVM